MSSKRMERVSPLASRATLAVGARCIGALVGAIAVARPLSAQSVVQPDPVGATAFVDVTTIPMIGARMREHQTLIVEDGTIVRLGDRATVTVPVGATVVDGAGKFLMPGLADAHVHLMEQGDLQRFLRYGVTTVRNLMGSPETLRWKRAVASGSLVGPRIITSGPLFAGPEIPWKSKVTPADPRAARVEVRRQRDAGYDLIKIYDGTPADIYAAVVDEARRLGMRVTGHIPAEVHLSGVLRARQDIEHTDKIVFDVWGHAFDATRIDSVAAAIRAAGVFVTPTIASMEQLARIGSGGFDSLLARPDARLAGPETVAFWCDVSSRLAGNRRPRPGVRYDPWTDFQLQVIAGLARAGVPLLAGTDYPNAMLAPGSGLHEELRALTDAGLTPFEALTAATSAVAAAIGDSTSGIIASGARADLLLLGANPLDGLGALDAVEGVMADGRWFTRSDLERLAPAPASAPTCAPSSSPRDED